MELFISILPQIIAGLIVAASGGVAALVFHIWRRRRRIAQLRQVEAECWDVLKIQEDMRKFLQTTMGEDPSQSDFISERLKVLEASRGPVVARRDQARDELSKLQSGLSD